MEVDPHSGPGLASVLEGRQPAAPSEGVLVPTRGGWILGTEGLPSTRPTGARLLCALQGPRRPRGVGAPLLDEGNDMGPRSVGGSKVTPRTLCFPGFYMQRTCPSERGQIQTFSDKNKTE